VGALHRQIAARMNLMLGSRPIRDHAIPETKATMHAKLGKGAGLFKFPAGHIAGAHPILQFRWKTAILFQGAHSAFLNRTGGVTRKIGTTTSLNLDHQEVVRHTD
jgi:hypothetical protein